MLAPLSKALIWIDLFGYRYEFGFNDKHGEYKTKLGGITTFFIGILIIWQTLIQMQLMISFGNDDI